MFRYYFKLGVRSLRRNPVLTALMVLTLAVGVAASVSTLTILHVMSGDPIPHKSDRLFVPLLDNGPLRRLRRRATEPDDDQMTYRDAANLLAQRPGRAPHRALRHRAARSSRRARDLPVDQRAGPRRRRATSSRCSRCRSCTAAPWTAAEDEARRRRGRAQPRAWPRSCSATDNPVGKRLRLFGQRLHASSACSTHWKPRAALLRT